MTRHLLFSAALAAAILPASADKLAHINMEASKGGAVKESVTNSILDVRGRNLNENMPGAVGRALRFDGYTTFVNGSLRSLGSAADDALSVSVWVAPETYPIVKIDQATDDKIALVSTLDEAAKKGWEMRLGYTGKYSFVCFVGGWRLEVNASDLLPTYEWSRLVAVVDSNAKKAFLYRNGKLVGESKANGKVDNSSLYITIGKGNDEAKFASFNINTFNGLIDDIEVYSHALTEAETAARPENDADLSIPASRFEGDILRPRFHGMPAANWTNECHGLTYSDGRYHLFFQKNANGPFMTRLHWGHISSENLYDWREEKIALMPSEPHDIKGCWSGCVFTDEQITKGKPNILYTGVDYARASISMATPQDDALAEWKKVARNPLISGRPSGLSDDFRDPFFFRSGDNAYIVVGSSKDGVGTTTLHRYNASTGSWSNDGSLFFTGKTPQADGKFWEMPAVVDMGSKWIFVTTPLETSTGTKALYRTGSINADGTFAPDAASQQPRQVELISRDGFGMLSPSIFQHDGKTLALGIVPDKLPGESNNSLGWAHCYSLPREWSLSPEGELLQKPFSGLAGMRSATGFSRSSFSLDGELSLDPVEGRQVEILGEFTVGSASFGYNFFKNGRSQATLSYNPSTRALTLDVVNLKRLSNDGHVYDGRYSCTLPQGGRPGDTMKLHLFIDGSIADIFVDDRYATSIRLFPTDEEGTAVEAFSQGSTEVKSLSAWVLDAHGGAGIDLPTFDFDSSSAAVDVIDMQGRIVRRGVDRSEAAAGLDPGIYLIGGRKVLIK